MAEDLVSNAGTERTREACVAAAQARATAIGRAVGVYQHVGGRHPKRGQVQATGQHMWRDLTDGEGRTLGTPKFVWAEVEVVQP